MSNLNDPFDAEKDIWSEESPTAQDTTANPNLQMPSLDDQRMLIGQAKGSAIPEHIDARTPQETDAAAVGSDNTLDLDNEEKVMERCVENAIMQGIFGSDINRRGFLKAVGRAAAVAAISSAFPMAQATDLVKELAGWSAKKVEKKKLKIGFVPITCSAPLIAAHPLGIYADNGLDVDVVKTAGWAVARDKMLSGEYDASHLLAPMPLAMTMGTGSTAKDIVTPAMQNTNGQAIVLANKYKDVRDPKKWKGFKFGVPFEYSMHNFLLRYYVAEHGLDPDKDIQIRVVPPPEMVANLRAGNVDGYLAPDPFCQRAVYDGVGFIHMLTKEIWQQHPCCAFGVGKKFAVENPNTFIAIYKSVVESIIQCSKMENRVMVSEAIHTKNYLNQPLTVVKQVMTGTFADGLGNVRKEPDRIHFAPLPAQSMAVWILSQMKRWGYVKGDVNYKPSLMKFIYLLMRRKLCRKWVRSHSSSMINTPS